MRSRQTLVEQFSTFLDLEADRFQRWLSDGRLQRSMERCLAQFEKEPASRSWSANFWALFWHRRWQQPSPHQLAQDHLAAYVQESCYWVAYKTVSRFAMTTYSLADCFQMAFARFDRVLLGFNAEQGGNFQNYASATLNALLRECLRQRQEIDICSDWGLLRKLSQKRLHEALAAMGFSEGESEKYRLVWQGFKLLYTPEQATKTRRLPKPENETLVAIATYYNQERQTQLSQPGDPITPDHVSPWLQTCARAARAYLYPSVVSANAPQSEEDAGEWIETFVDEAQTELLSAMVEAEEVGLRSQQRTQLNQVLDSTLQTLDRDSQTLLQLYYQANCTQQEIAKQLEIKQYTVSRRLTKVRETLLQALTHWCQETLHITLDLDLLKTMGTTLDEWLASHYRHDPAALETDRAE
jgi:RNA polymerase sigma factor (sigma-70 family)